jgi:hypothetical protein
MPAAWFRRPLSAVQIVNQPEGSNIEPPVHERRGVRNETAEDRILHVSVQIILRFVALVEEPRGGVFFGSM